MMLSGGWMEHFLGDGAGCAGEPGTGGETQQAVSWGEDKEGLGE